MHTADLRQRLAAILNEEEREQVDWSTVDQMLDRLNGDLKASPECPHFVHHFISDGDIRAKDAVYGDHQRIEVRRFVDTGEHEEGIELIWPLSCLALAALGGLAFWLG